jgi:hypothetical protein
MARMNKDFGGRWSVSWLQVLGYSFVEPHSSLKSLHPSGFILHPSLPRLCVTFPLFLVVRYWFFVRCYR